MAVAPDRGHRARRVDERVVLRHRAVVVDAMDLAVRALQVLGRVEVAAIADRVVEMLALVPEEAAAEVRVVGPEEILRRLEQRLLLDQRTVLDLAADHPRRRGALGAAARLAEGEVDPAVLGVVGMDGGVHQAAVLPHPDRRQARDRRAGDAVAEDAQPPDALGHEQRAVGQDHRLPRVVEAVDDRLDPEGVQLGLHHVGRERRRRARQQPAGGVVAQLADVDHHRADVLVAQGAAERRHRRARPPVLDAGGDLGVTAAVRPRVVEQARRRSAAAVGAVTVGAHLREGVDDAARRLGGLRGRRGVQVWRGRRRAEKAGGDCHPGEPSIHGR